jgi:hypothetical protein
MRVASDLTRHDHVALVCGQIDRWPIAKPNKEKFTLTILRLYISNSPFYSRASLATESRTGV